MPIKNPNNYPTGDLSVKRTSWTIAAALIVGFFSPISFANAAPQTRSLPANSELYSLPCDEPTNYSPERFAEGQLAVVNTSTGIMTNRGQGITDANIRDQIGSHNACVVGATYDSLSEKAYYVTGYLPYNNGKTAFYELDIITGVSRYIAALTPGNSLGGADSLGRIDIRGIATDNEGRMFALWKGMTNLKYYVGLVNKSTGVISTTTEIEADLNTKLVNEGPFHFAYFNNKFYTASSEGLRSEYTHLYSIDVSTGVLINDVAIGDKDSSGKFYSGFAIDSNGVIWDNETSMASATIAGWALVDDVQVTARTSQWYVSQYFIGPKVAAVTAGEAPNSRVASIPSGVTTATIPATASLPTTKLNFGGTVPTAVTVVPVATNPAPAAATPFTISGSTKIVDLQITGTFTGSATVCLDGASTDHLFHFTSGAWVELPSRTYVDGQVCGVTTSFSPFTAAPPITVSLVASTAAADAAAKAAAEAAAAKREAEKKAARADITSNLKNSKDLKVETFVTAEIAGITATNIALVQAELLALPEESRADFNQILKIARKYEVVGNIGSGRINYLQSNSYIEIGLIPATSKNKVALVAAVRKLPESARDTYAEIKTAIDAEAAKIKKRNDRLTAAISRNGSRSTR